MDEVKHIERRTVEATARLLSPQGVAATYVDTLVMQQANGMYYFQFFQADPPLFPPDSLSEGLVIDSHIQAKLVTNSKTANDILRILANSLGKTIVEEVGPGAQPQVEK